jgi:hypothetical protein
LGNVPLGVANTQLRRSSSPHHSGGSVIGPFIALFELQFIFTMALKALEELHSLTASSPTSESRPSSQWVPDSMLDGCRAMFSLEISKDVTEIEKYAFSNCYCLRNVAFPPDAVFEGEGNHSTSVKGFPESSNHRCPGVRSSKMVGWKKDCRESAGDVVVGKLGRVGRYDAFRYL